MYDALSMRELLMLREALNDARDQFMDRGYRNAADEMLDLSMDTAQAWHSRIYSQRIA